PDDMSLSRSYYVFVDAAQEAASPWRQDSQKMKSKISIVRRERTIRPEINERYWQDTQFEAAPEMENGALRDMILKSQQQDTDWEKAAMERAREAEQQELLAQIRSEREYLEEQQRREAAQREWERLQNATRRELEREAIRFEQEALMLKERLEQRRLWEERSLRQRALWQQREGALLAELEAARKAEKDAADEFQQLEYELKHLGSQRRTLLLQEEARRHQGELPAADKHEVDKQLDLKENELLLSMRRLRPKHEQYKNAVVKLEEELAVLRAEHDAEEQARLKVPSAPGGGA
ncbi:hypothetical protein CYMTET_35820, partial [Cymbomonas tetramitiformis]